MKTIREIQEEFARASEDGYDALYEKYQDDGRKGVAAILKKYRKDQERLKRERERIFQMQGFERKYADCQILYLDDSKRLSAKKREGLYPVILEQAVAVGVGYASPARIDEINILQATYEAMREAVGRLDVEPQLLLNDAVTIPDMTIPQVPLIHGDARSVSIAAASIVAKVTRDRLMVRYDSEMPQYGFAAHKGYGSAAHLEALQKYGPSPIHRRSFLKNFKNIPKGGAG